MYDLAYCKAKEMVQKNRGVLEKIVEELLEFEILTGKVMAIKCLNGMLNASELHLSFVVIFSIQFEN